MDWRRFRSGDFLGGGVAACVRACVGGHAHPYVGDVCSCVRASDAITPTAGACAAIMHKKMKKQHSDAFAAASVATLPFLPATMGGGRQTGGADFFLGPLLDQGAPSIAACIPNEYSISNPYLVRFSAS